MNPSVRAASLQRVQRVISSDVIIVPSQVIPPPTLSLIQLLRYYLTINKGERDVVVQDIV